jgi:hypothetical protein
MLERMSVYNIASGHVAILCNVDVFSIQVTEICYKNYEATKCHVGL